MKRKIKIMMVEDNPEYKNTIVLALEDEPDIELISQFGTSEIALRSLQDMSTRNVPDLVLLDLRLPGMNGLDSMPYFRKALPNTKIIILTQSDNEADVLRAISSGTSGYLLKSSTVDQITDAIRTVMAGGASLDSGVARFILDTLKNQLPKRDLENVLTKRELEILTLLGEGLVKKEIADHLHIGYTTVDTHVSHIYEKLKVRNAPSAINKAHKLGFFPPKD
ncbi:MAG: response regulator transcription factor [Verrucomicrobiota bacterium]|nr:response regulator transcription factor [Verrucomicrobiota bacterium]